MVGTPGDQTNIGRLFILLNSVGITYCADPSNVTDRSSMAKIPPKLRYLSSKQNWRLIKDEIRSLTHMHGLDIPEKGYDVNICFRHGELFAICQFKHNDDTREVFSMYIDKFCFPSLANRAG